MQSTVLLSANNGKRCKTMPSPQIAYVSMEETRNAYGGVSVVGFEESNKPWHLPKDFLCVRHCSGCLVCINPFDLLNSPMKWIPGIKLSAFYEWNKDRLSDFMRSPSKYLVEPRFKSRLFKLYLHLYLCLDLDLSSKAGLGSEGWNSLKNLHGGGCPWAGLLGMDGEFREGHTRSRGSDSGASM